MLSLFSHSKGVPASKVEAEVPKALKSKFTGSRHSTVLKQEEISISPKVVKNFACLAGKCLSGFKN